MARPRSISSVTCQNPKCRYYHIQNGKDILKRGKSTSGHQQYYCNHCRTWFVETSNTLFYHKHLSHVQILSICRLLIEKKGIREIEHITGHHRDTIGHLMTDLAIHAEQTNTFLMHEGQISPFDLRKMWLFVKKRKRKLSRIAQEQINQVMHTL